MLDIFYSIIINALLLIILFIPLIFTWKHKFGKFYFRIIIGITIFYLIYWILPILFQLGESPTKLSAEDKGADAYLLGIRYIFTHFGSLIASFVFYPLVTLPFIFFIAPFISILILFNHLRKEEGSIKENLLDVTYEFEQSPFKKVWKELQDNDWTREKQILKLMIVLLPISLYLLQVILDISELENISLTTGETSLGWFIEILLVYLATFIFSIELLYSSKISFKGRYFGEQIRDQTFRSLYMVGTPISILSLILFVVQYTSSIFIIIYFMAYFIMVTIIFLLFFKIFEPISILLFVKIIEYWKKKEEKSQTIERIGCFYMLVFSALSIGIYLALYVLVFNLLFGMFGEEQSVIVNSARFSYNNPSLQNAFRFDLLNMFNIVVLVIIPIFITAYLFAYGLKYVRNIWLSSFIFFAIIILISILMIFMGANPLISFTPEEYWLTGQISYTDVFGFNYYTFRTTAFDANLFPEGKITLLGILAIPYLFTRYVITIMFWSIILYYINREFKIKEIPVDEKHEQRVLYATIGDFLTFNEYKNTANPYLVSRKEALEKVDLENEGAQLLLDNLQTEKTIEEMRPGKEAEMKRHFMALKELFYKKQIKIWKPEISYLFEKIEKQGLYIIYKDGRDIFNYTFVEEQLQDPGLISGMFTAITSFIKETTKSTQLLKTIDHGDITILIEYGANFFGALFIKGTQTSEIRSNLKNFINQFEKQHKDVLVDWNGMLTPFREDHLLVKKIFKEE
jgi:hypothetical protein